MSKPYSAQRNYRRHLAYDASPKERAAALEECLKARTSLEKAKADYERACRRLWDVGVPIETVADALNISRSHAHRLMTGK